MPSYKFSEAATRIRTHRQAIRQKPRNEQLGPVETSRTTLRRHRVLQRKLHRLCPVRQRILSANFHGRCRFRLQLRRANKNKSSEVMLGPFVSASSSLLDPCLTCYRSFPFGMPRDLRSGSGLTANRKNLPNASELYPAFDVSSCSPRPALCYRPLLALPVHFHEEGDCA